LGVPPPSKRTNEKLNKRICFSRLNGIALKRRTIIAVFFIVVLAVSLALVAYNSYRATQIDTSWVEKVNSKLEGYNYLNDSETEFDGLAAFKLKLIENGTKTYIVSKTNDTLSDYLFDLLNQTTLQKGTLSNSELNELLSSSRVVEMTFRFFVTVNHSEYSQIYFMLDSSQGLTGTILAQDRESSSFDILEVCKLPPFP
jgi:hypothetical protein